MPIENGGKEVKVMETWIWRSLDLGLDPRPPFPDMIKDHFLDAIAFPSTYPCQSVGHFDSFRFGNS